MRGGHGVAPLPLLRWIGDHVRGFHAAVGVYLLAGTAMIVAALLGFVALADAMLRGRTEAFDYAVMERMADVESPALHGWALDVTALGGKVVVPLVVIVASVALWSSRHRYSAILLWIAVSGAAGVNALLKISFDRSRPEVFDWRTPHAGLSSFPSGHSTTAVVVYGTLAFLVARLMPTVALRALTWVVALAIIVAVALSRVYLGVHYPSDVVAGALVGGAWAVICGMGIEAVRYFRGRRPGIATRERDLGPGPTEREERGGEPA
jgi:undecaprenyl-diphosphatase